MTVMLFILRLEHPMDDQWPSNSDQKSSSFDAGSKKLKHAHTSSSEAKPVLSSSSEALRIKPEKSPQSGRVAWPDEERQEDSALEAEKDEKTKVGDPGKKKRKKRRRRRKQKDAVEEVEVVPVRPSWRRGETSSSSASSGNKGNSRENNTRGLAEKDTVETLMEAEKVGDGESDGCIEEAKSKEEEDAFDAVIGLDAAAGRRALRMKRSFATTADSSCEEKEVVKVEGSCCDEEGRSSLLGGNFERAVVHNCSDHEALMTCSTDNEKAEKGSEIGGRSLLMPGCLVTARVENENESEKGLLNSDLEEDTSKCSLGVVAMGAGETNEKEDEIFDPPSTEILDYKSILSALKEKHREEQRRIQETASSPLFWPPTGW